jgi:hypothetical protein
LGAVATLLQMTLNLILLQRELGLKLIGDQTPLAQTAAVGIITGE